MLDIFDIHMGSRATNADIYGGLCVETHYEIHHGQPKEPTKHVMRLGIALLLTDAPL